MASSAICWPGSPAEPPRSSASWARRCRRAPSRCSAEARSAPSSTSWRFSAPASPCLSWRSERFRRSSARSREVCCAARSCGCRSPCCSPVSACSSSPSGWRRPTRRARWCSARPVTRPIGCCWDSWRGLGRTGGLGLAAFGAFLVVLTAAVVAFVLWLELAVRSAAIAAAALFLPLALVGARLAGDLALGAQARRDPRRPCALQARDRVGAGACRGVVGKLQRRLGRRRRRRPACCRCLRAVRPVEARSGRGGRRRRPSGGSRPAAGTCRPTPGYRDRRPRIGGAGGLEALAALGSKVAGGAGTAVRTSVRRHSAQGLHRRRARRSGRRRATRRGSSGPRLVSAGVFARPVAGQAPRQPIGRQRRDSAVPAPAMRRATSARSTVARWTAALPRRPSSMAERAARYQLGPRSRRGLVAGWRGGQLAAVGAGLVAGVLLLRSVGGALGALLAFARWSPSRGLRDLAARRPECRAVDAGRGVAPRRRQAGVARRGRRGRSPRSSSTRFRSVSPGRRIGVVVDSAAGTWTAAVRVGGSGFALGDEAGSGPPRSRPGPACWRGRHAKAEPFTDCSGWRVACPAASTTARYRREAPIGGRGSQLPVAARAGAPRRCGATRCSSPCPSGRRRDRLVAEVARHGRQIVEELEALERRCLAAGLEVDGVLSPSALAATIRSSFAVAGAPRGVADGWPWPLGVEESWSSIRTDATWHASTGSPNGPATGVGSGFLLPLMLEGGLRRTIAVTMAPVAPLRAVRRAEHDRTSGAADAELRRRHGFAVTARTRHEHEATTRRETELAEGHAAFRFTGYLAVTADDEAALAAACGRLEQTARTGSARAAPHVRRPGGGLHLHPADGRGCA